MNMSIKTNRIAQLLIQSGYIDNFIEAPQVQAATYQFFTDDKADMKVMLSALTTARCAVIGAALRDANISQPLFDEEHSTIPSTSELVDRLDRQPEQPMSLAEAQRHERDVYQMALSLSRHDGNRWAQGFAISKAVKDPQAVTGWRVESSNVTMLRDFDGWMSDQLASTPSDSTWFAALIQAKQLGVTTDIAQCDDIVESYDPNQWDGDYDAFIEAQAGEDNETHEVQARVFEWMGTVPWTRDNDSRTRCEKIVSRVADGKFNAFIKALETKNSKAMTKALTDWTLIVHSPKMHSMMKEIAASPVYQNHLLSIQMDAQSAQLDRLEFLEEQAAMKAQLAARQQALDERMAKFMPAAVPKVDTAKAATSFGFTMTQLLAEQVVTAPAQGVARPRTLVRAQSHLNLRTGRL